MSKYSIEESSMDAIADGVRWRTNRADKMTPAEYEKYLEGMSEAEFSEYLAREEKRFADMKAKSAENAHMAAKNYKEFTEKSIGGLSDEICGSFEEI